MAARVPHLHRALRCFCLAAFALLAADVEAGEEVEFAFDEHGARRDGPALYEYRPLVRAYVEARASRLRTLEDARISLQELDREPSAAIFARAHAGPRPAPQEALFRSVLLPLIVTVAEARGGFDWGDDAFDRAYGELERSLLGSRRTYAAVAPLVGISVGAQVDLGGGLRVRAVAAGELAAHWPESSRLSPEGFGREPDRACVLELERELEAGETEPPDAPGELADAVTAVRLATAGPVATGAVVFERLDWRPYGIRPALPIAAAQPAGEPTRLDQFRGGLARELRARLPLADEDPGLGEALDRWELSLFQPEPSRSDQLRDALVALLGGRDGLWPAALRAALLLGEPGRERALLHERLRALADGEPAGKTATDAVRRALVETLSHGDREALVASLDEALLALRPRPAGSLAVRAVAG